MNFILRNGFELMVILLSFLLTVSSAIFHTFPAASISPSYAYLWYTPSSKTWLLFKVQACSDVRILLAEYVLVTDYNVYEIGLGANNNGLSVIRYGINGVILAQQTVPDVLHCTSAKWFWIDWSRGISVGTGYLVGDSSFLSVTNLPHQFEIGAISIASGQSNDGVWEFTSVPGT